MIQLSVKNFEPIKDRFLKLSTSQDFEKECSFAIQHLQKNSYLAKSTPNSLLMSVLNIVQVGLTLNPVQKLAYLVPRYNRSEGAIECHLEPSYQGLVKLLTDGGSVTNCYAHLIYENDHFEQILGTENEIIHKPKLGDKGKVVGAYAVAVLFNGSKQCEVMGIEEIEEIRNTSESYKAYKAGKAKSCIWMDWFDEMSRKTVIKRLVKYLPKTKFEKLAKAISLADEDYQADYSQLSYIDSLLLTSSIAEERKEDIERRMNTFSSEEARETISMLKDNQTNPIHSGRSYSQTDIKKELK